MLAKIISKNVIKKPYNNEILINADKQIINPRDEDFINAGYKQLVEIPQPYYDEETQYLIPYYEEKENKIEEHWVIQTIIEESEELE